jgi:hypothetical protein
MITKVKISCVWGGHLAGILMKTHSANSITRATKKIIGVHGWLDNLNSLLPLAEKLIERHPSKLFVNQSRENIILFFQIMKFVYTIVLVMDFLATFQKVVIIPWIPISEIFVLSLKVSIILIDIHFSMSVS